MNMNRIQNYEAPRTMWMRVHAANALCNASPDLNNSDNKAGKIKAQEGNTEFNFQAQNVDSWD